MQIKKKWFKQVQAGLLLAGRKAGLRQVWYMAQRAWLFRPCSADLNAILTMSRFANAGGQLFFSFFFYFWIFKLIQWKWRAFVLFCLEISFQFCLLQ